MSYLKKDILYCLSEYADDTRLITVLNDIVEKNGDIACAIILNSIIHTEYSPSEAKIFWDEIVAHHRVLSETLKRDVGLRTAIFDYFSSVKKTIKNSMLVDAMVFEEKTKSPDRDNLTGLYTQSYFEDALKRELAGAKRRITNVSVVVFDIDNLQKINDIFGNIKRDMFLKNIGSLISETIRTEDIAARYSNEKVAILLPMTNKTAAFIFSKRIQGKIEKYEMNDGGRYIFSTVSGGIATFPEDGKEPVSLLRNVNFALQLSRKSGKKSTISAFSR